jgi:hypothetical protein
MSTRTKRDREQAQADKKATRQEKAAEATEKRRETQGPENAVKA